MQVSVVCNSLHVLQKLSFLTDQGAGLRFLPPELPRPLNREARAKGAASSGFEVGFSHFNEAKLAGIFVNNFHESITF